MRSGSGYPSLIRKERIKAILINIMSIRDKENMISIILSGDFQYSGLLKYWDNFVNGFIRIKNGDILRLFVRKDLMISRLPRIIPFRIFAFPPVRIFTNISGM